MKYGSREQPYIEIGVYIKTNNNNNKKNNLKAVSCPLELFVYVQLVTCTRLSRNAQFTGSHYLPISTKIFANILYLSFSMKLTFSARECH